VLGGSLIALSICIIYDKACRIIFRSMLFSMYIYYPGDGNTASY
jgi:hypothetical protein